MEKCKLFNKELKKRLGKNNVVSGTPSELQNMHNQLCGCKKITKKLRKI